MGDSALKTASTVALHVVVLVTCTFLAGCGSSVDPKQAIVGTWAAETGGSTWTFNPDGTAVSRSAKDDKETPWTYKIIDGDKIDMASSSPEVKALSQYRFDGKDRLTLLLGDRDNRPTRVAEAAKTTDIRLLGKGGGLVINLRRK